VRVVQGHPPGSFVRLSWSADGQRLASCGIDNQVMVWDAHTLQPTHTLMQDGVAFATCPGFSPDGRWLVVGEARFVETSERGNTAFSIVVWDLQTGSRLAMLEGTNDLMVAAWNEAGTLLAYKIYNEPWIRFWSVPESGIAIPEPVSLPSFEVGKLYWRMDGTLAAIGVRENGLVHWRSTSPRELAAADLPPYDGYVYAYSPDGSLAASLVDLPIQATVSVSDLGIYIWDTFSGEMRSALQSHDFYGFGGLAFNPDNTWLAAAKHAVNVYAVPVNEVRLWDLASGGVAAILPGGPSEISSIAFSPDGRTLAAGEANGEIRLWQLDAYWHSPITPTPIPTPTPVTVSSFTPVFDSSLTVVGVNPDEPEYLSSLRWLDDGTLQGGGYPASAFSPDGRKIAYWDRGDLSGPEAELFGVFDARTNTPFFQIPATELGRGKETAWSPDGSRIAVQTFTSIELLEVPTGARLLTLEDAIEQEGQAIYKNVIWSPDGKWIASSLEGAMAMHRVIIWDAATGEIFRVYEQAPVYGGGESVGHIAFSPDSSKLLLVKGDVEILDVLSGELQTLPAGSALSQFAGTGAWSADGVYIAVDYRENYRGMASILFWNTETDEVFILHTRSRESFVYFNLVWAPDRPLLATIDGSDVYLLDAEERAITRLELQTIASPKRLAWSPDGSKLAVGSEERAVEIWSFQFSAKEEERLKTI
jgi:WD40 repeat protein